MADAKIKSQRLKLRLEFDGANFCGWQLQSEGEGYLGLPSLQAVVEKSLATVLRRPGERFPVQGCGRTDSGVHAEEFFCHTDLPLEDAGNAADLEKLRHRMNCVLPETIVCTEIFNAPGFHAIEDASSKIYEYRILLRRAKPTLHRGRCYWLPVDPEDVEAFDKNLLAEALKLFVGKHDFVAFAATNSTAKTTVREILRTEVEIKNLGNRPWDGELLTLRFEGRGFLKQMVRNLSGTAIEVAQKKRSIDSIKKLIDEPGLRKNAGFCAPPEGLFLVRVKYPQGGEESS